MKMMMKGKQARSLKQTKEIMESESRGAKNMIIISSVLTMAITVVLAGLYWFRFASAVRLQKIAEDNYAMYNNDVCYYDYQCSGAYAHNLLQGRNYNRIVDRGVGLTNWKLDDWKDSYKETTTKALEKTFGDDAGDAFDILVDLENDCDQDCIAKGSNWGNMYLANGLILTIIALNLLCAFVGTWKPMWRFMAGSCANMICCAHFGIWIATGVARLGKLGRLCAMNRSGSNYPSDDVSEANDDWTYEKDGKMLLAFWILQLFGMCLCNMVAVNPMRVKK